MDWPTGAVLDRGWSLLSLRKGLEEGTHYTFDAFDIDSLKPVIHEVAIGPTRPVDVLGSKMELTGNEVHGEDGLWTVRYVDRKGDSWKDQLQVLGTKMEIIRSAASKRSPKTVLCRL